MKWTLIMHMYHVSGWWFQPLWKKIRPLGLLFPIYGKIKHVPNHQPGLYWDVKWSSLWSVGKAQGGHNSGRVPLPAAKQLDVHGIRIPPLKDLRHERAAGEPWTSQWTSLGVNMLNRYNSPYASDVAERNSLSGSTSNGKRNTRMFLVGESRNVLQPSDARPEDAKQLRYVSHAVYRVSPVKKHLQT